MTESCTLRGELLSLISQIKARVQDRIGSIDIPLPQFIVVGKQSVGKSRLLEALAGEQFNFVSGTLGSRRPTVLEFRHNASLKTSKWSLFDPSTKSWKAESASRVMEIVGAAHESLKNTVSNEAVFVKLESPKCVDMLVTDLPGFRDFSLDADRQGLADKILDLVTRFMSDPRNVMLCVEEAGDAATLSTLAKCKRHDPDFARTILIRNKLDKYYKDLDSVNVNQWVLGYGDLPEHLPKFSLTLPNWKDGTVPDSPFETLRTRMNDLDLQELRIRGLSESMAKFIGFSNFKTAMELKTEEIFAAAVEPVLKALKQAEAVWVEKKERYKIEFTQTDPDSVAHSIRSAGQAFARALNHVMEGQVPGTDALRVTLEEELHDFHEWAMVTGNYEDFDLLPSVEFADLTEYVEYLNGACKIPGFSTPLSGGAQYTRLKTECEIYFRFSDVCLEVNKRDVIQARGISIGQVSWQDVVLKLLAKEGQPQVLRKVNYVGARIQWFFQRQKEVVIEFMNELRGSPDEHLYSRLFTNKVQLIKENELCRNLIFGNFDQILDNQRVLFADLFNNTLQSTFANPWALVKGSSWVPEEAMGEDEDVYLPSFEDTKARIPIEIAHRSSVEGLLRKLVNEIPTDVSHVDVAVERVQMLMIVVFNNIRNLICEQLDLFSDSFFQLPMIRHLEASMATIKLEDPSAFLTRRDQVKRLLDTADETVRELQWGIAQVATFAYRTTSLGK